MSRYRNYRKEVWFSVFHGLALAVLTLVWMNLSWEFGDEVIVARINQIARYEIFDPPNQVVSQFKKDLLLINTSYDKTVVPFSDDGGSGKIPITDRRMLAQFFDVISSAPVQPRLVVLDIMFDHPSGDDSVLQASLRKVHNLVISCPYDADDNPVVPWPGFTFALPRYETTTGMFLKYNLVSDTVHFLPAAMLRKTHGTTFAEKGGLVYDGESWWMNSFIVDLPVRKVHMDNGEVLTWNMSDALQFEPDAVHRLVADRIMIVGDYYIYDSHETLLGDQPGPLIVANAYLGMMQGIPRIELFDGVMIFILYFFSTLYVLVWRRTQVKLPGLPGIRFGRFIIKYLTYIVIFSLYSILLYLLTSRHFQLLLFGLYFNVFEYLYERYSPRVLSAILPEPVIEGANVD